MSTLVQLSFLDRSASAESCMALAKRHVCLARGVPSVAAARTGVDASLIEGFLTARHDELLELCSRHPTRTVIAGLAYRSTDDRDQHFNKVRKGGLQIGFSHRRLK